MVNDKKKNYTIEEYEKLKQEVINLRQLAVAEAGSEKHKSIFVKLCRLEEELANAIIVTGDTEKKIIPKEYDAFLDSNNIISRRR